MKTRFIFLLLVLTGIFTCRLSADSIEVSGTISGTWEVDTVNVTGNIHLREAEELTISPGVTVLFRGEYFFEVDGSLKAIGNEGSTIRFTMADTTGFSNDTLPRGGWNQIRIENINSGVDSILFRYCHFEYGKAVSADSVHGYGGALCIRNSNKIAIENCTFFHNYAFFSGGALYLDNADILVNKNVFDQNRCGQAFVYYGYGGGLCSDNGEPLICRNIFIENSSTGVGGGLTVRFNDCRVSHNIFHNNYSALGGGFGILHIVACDDVITNNLFYENSSTFFGGAISNNDCSPTYVNNTICNNYCEGGGGGFYCKDSVVPVLVNNILFGNTHYNGEPNQVYLWDLLSQPDFYFNDLEGGRENFAGTGGVAFSGYFENNIDTNPEFENGTFIPENGSLCINNGSPDTTGLMVPELDLSGANRIIQTIDMGAYENQEPVFVPDQRIDQEIDLRISPNPSPGKIHISVSLVKTTHIKVGILDENGKMLKPIFSGRYSAGVHHQWINDGAAFPNGVYFVVVESDNIKFTRKLVISL